jgi:hypothetical protein
MRKKGRGARKIMKSRRDGKEKGRKEKEPWRREARKGEVM